MARPDIVEKINEFNTWTPRQVVEAYGGSIGRASAAMVGKEYTRGISKDMEYKRAKRSLERQLKGKQGVGTTSQARLNKAGRQAEKGKNIGITFTGTAAVNGRGEDYESERDIDRVYDEDEWERLSELAAAGDEEGIWDLIADEYGVASFELIDGDINIGEE